MKHKILFWLGILFLVIAVLCAVSVFTIERHVELGGLITAPAGFCAAIIGFMLLILATNSGSRLRSRIMWSIFCLSLVVLIAQWIL